MSLSFFLSFVLSLLLSLLSFVPTARACPNPRYCLFKYSDAGNYALEINKDSSVNPEHLIYFRFVGRLVALAIYHGFFIDNGFTVPLYKQLLDKPLTLKDVDAVDPEFHTSLKWILENDIVRCCCFCFLVWPLRFPIFISHPWSFFSDFFYFHAII